MWPDQVSNPGPLALQSAAIPTVLHSRADILLYYGVYIHLSGKLPTMQVENERQLQQSSK